MKKHKRKKYKRHNKHFTFTIPLLNTPDSILSSLQIQPQEEDDDIWNITPFDMYLIDQFFKKEGMEHD